MTGKADGFAARRNELTDPRPRRLLRAAAELSGPSLDLRIVLPGRLRRAEGLARDIAEL
ncbi:hypothetical protein [Nocardia sp. NPDC050710]|uniref:hypothetical protein n=1 Tax=Nocardia sp. NPDC050710 TaxID=3157220 RepID=UPI00340EA6DA